MNNIEKNRHEELVSILNELVETIGVIKKEEINYRLNRNEIEVKEWLEFCKTHTDKEELQSLEEEIADRFFYMFNFQLGTSELDIKRIKLMKKFMFKCDEYLF